jgi:hypothetical protein
MEGRTPFSAQPGHIGPQIVGPQARTSRRMNPAGIAMPEDSVTISPGPQFRSAMLVAIAADALQLVVFPLFVAGAISPADDVLDLGIGAVMVHLLGWHWEFLPTFLAKLVPGVDLVPFWTLAVANVWRKAKAMAATEKPALPER